MKKNVFLLLIFMLIICCSNIIFATEDNQYVISTKLRVDNYNEEKIIYGVDLENGEISKNILCNSQYFNEILEVKTYDINGNEIVDASKRLGTGTKIKLYQSGSIVSEYTLIIYGDINCDGKITTIDALALIKAINKKINYVIPACENAGKIITTDTEKSPTAVDALAIIKHLNGKYEISQSKEIFCWDTTSDASKDIVIRNLLNFKITALDCHGNITNGITWEVSAGSLDQKSETEVKWTLPPEEGTYKISAKLSNGKTLEKEVKYVDISTIEEEGIETEEIEISENGDEDSDGLTNKEERGLGTDIFYNDTDTDGIDDHDEVKEYGTNPLLKDTDADGIDDLNEIILNLSPLMKDSDGDGTPDAEESLTYTTENDEIGVKANIKGNANIADTQISSVEVKDITPINAIVSPVYDFNTSGEVESATVYINYDKDVINNKGINEENLSLYHFDPLEYTFEKVETTIDSENDVAVATLNHFSMYLLADKSTMIDTLNNQIMFVIDNSGSMYTYEQAVEKNKNTSITNEDLKSTPANDPEYKRLNMVSYLIDKLDNNFEYGISKFTGSYTELSQMGANRESLNDALEKIKTEGETFDGTYVGTSVYLAAFQFPVESAFNRYIVLVSDGGDTAPSSGIIREMAIQTAKEKNIKVITIGLGNQVNQAELREYSDETGGMYYHVDNAEMLDNLYTSLCGKLNLGRETIENENGDNDNYLVVADSGFISESNGFPFENYITARNEGQCYGISVFCKEFYNNTLNFTDDKTIKFFGETINFNYDLTSIDALSKHNNLINYDFQNVKLKKLMLSSNKERLNYDKLEEDFNRGIEVPHAELKEEYRQYVEGTNGIVKIKKTVGTSSYGKVTYDGLYIDVDECTSEEIEKNSDLQLFKAIEYLHMNQINEKGTNVDKDIHEDINKSSIFEKTIERIDDGTPLVISYKTYIRKLSEDIRWLFSKTDHAVDGIRVLRNVEDTNKYKIAIYNCNSPGETQYLNIEKVNTLLGTVLCCYEQGDHCTNIYIEK